MRSVLFVLLVFTATASQATLISLDDRVYGRGSITLDTETDLEWLDVPLSGGYSINQILTETQYGGAFEGFRYGFYEEVMQLFENAGAPCSPDRGLCHTEVRGELAQATIDLFDLTGGATHIQSGTPTQIATHTVTEDRPGPPPPQVSYPYASTFIQISRGVPAAFINADNLRLVSDLDSPTFGHWLVRPSRSVPEPTTLLLLGLGLMGLVFTRRRLH